MINANKARRSLPSLVCKFLKINVLTPWLEAVTITLVSSSENNIRRAAKELRLRLGLSQEAFGQRIGRTLNTVLRYESQSAPREESLIRYAALAIDSGFNDLAEIFRLALTQDLGSDLVRVLNWEPTHRALSVPLTEDMSALVDAFVAFMSKPDRDLQPAESLARTSIKQMLLKQHAADRLAKRKSK